MTMSLGIMLGAIVGLLIVSAFFSGSETALTAASRARMHALEEDGNKRARIVNRLLDMRERFIGAILLGNNLANIAASALATTLFLKLFGEAGVIYATIVMSLLRHRQCRPYGAIRGARSSPAGGVAGAGDGRHAVDCAPYFAAVRRPNQRRCGGALGT